MSGGAKKKCKLCDDMLLFCPGCTLGTAREYGLHASCGFAARCPFCIDMDSTKADIKFWKDYRAIPKPTQDDERKLFDYTQFLTYYALVERNARGLPSPFKE